jgi:hypothetical protein
MRRLRRIFGWVLAVSLIVALTGPAAAAEGEWVFVSVPDFLNADVADLSAAPGWDGGENSQQPAQVDAISRWLDAMAAEHPEFVLVAGDLVMGHWDVDVDGRQLFGPVGTPSEKRAAISAAGDVIYPQWLRRFEERGLTVHAAVGDHDIGDDAWVRGRQALVDTYKSVFSEHLIDGRYSETYGLTSYAFKHRNLLVVSVDVFTLIDGEMHVTVTGDHLEWLDSVLEGATADYVIVQGHTPVLGPVRRQHSSGMQLEGGESSEFWETLCRHDVDLYFAGEFHDITVNDGCVTQVVHGGNINFEGDTNYLVVTVGNDGLDLTARVADVTPLNDRRVFQTGVTRPHADVTLGDFQVKGQAHYDGNWQGVGELKPVSNVDAIAMWSEWQFRGSRAVVPLLVALAIATAALLVMARRRNR